MMELRRRILSQTEHIPLIGGLPVYIDNAFYTGTNGTVNAYGINNNYFLTGVIDTGSTAQKRYTVTRMGVGGDTRTGTMRLFNDLSATSVDYWTIMRADMDYGSIVQYSLNSVGQYIILTVWKEFASDFYLKDANGNYLLKGSNVQ